MGRHRDSTRQSTGAAAPESPKVSPEAEPDPLAEAQDLKEGLSRRRFLAMGSGTAVLALHGASAAAARTAATCSAEPIAGASVKSAPASTQMGPTEAELDAHYHAFCEPPVEYSRYGVLDTTLHVVEAEVSVLEPSRVRAEQTRTYNGIVPGPTFRVQAGDRMNILLQNRLPPEPARCPPLNPNIPHCFNTTNLHTHGLHVSPEPPSDDVFLRLGPGEEAEVCVDLPAFHAPGTYWYHAHKHGSTAIQLVNGMSGALIVDDPPGTEPVPGARDVVMVLQEVIGERAQELLYEVSNAPGDVYNCMGGSPCSEEFFTINGCALPTLHVQPGEIQRWRLINATATPRGYTKLGFLGTAIEPDFCLVAVDGIYLPRSRRVHEWLLVPGGRADFLVQFPSAGDYVLLRTPTQGLCDPQPLVKVRVSGPPASDDRTCPSVLPPLPGYLAPITDEEWRDGGGLTRKLTFDVVGQGDPTVPCWERFLINGKTFDKNRIDQKMKLGTVERWEITNTSNASHPFHIHVNPFQVIQIGDKKLKPRERFWQDTVDLPPNTTVAFYSRFQTFHGNFVLHCHILNHEDWGMMQRVEVVGDGVPPCVPVP